MGVRRTKPTSGVDEVEAAGCLWIYRSPLLAPTLLPPRQVAEIPNSEHHAAPTRNRLQAPPGLAGAVARVVLQKGPPARPTAPAKHQLSGARGLAGFLDFKLSLSGAARRILPLLFPEWREKRTGKVFPHDPPALAHCAAGWPGFSVAPVLTLQGLRPQRDCGHRRSAECRQTEGREENQGTLTERSPPRGLGTRTACGAAQVLPRLRREFESRSRKGPRQPAAPAHRQLLSRPGRGQLLARPPGTPGSARLPSARQEVAERSRSCSGRAGGSEGARERGRGGPGIFPVGGDSGPRLRSSHWRLCGGRGNLRGLASQSRGKAEAAAGPGRG